MTQGVQSRQNSQQDAGRCRQPCDRSNCKCRSAGWHVSMPCCASAPAAMGQGAHHQGLAIHERGEAGEVWQQLQLLQRQRHVGDNVILQASRAYIVEDVCRGGAVVIGPNVGPQHMPCNAAPVPAMPLPASL